VAEGNSIELELDPKVRLGSRMIDAPRGLVQTLARLAEYVAGIKS
jgi:hypothetical protein